MMVKRVQEPETLSGIVEASLWERNDDRRQAFEGKLRDVNEELLLAKLAEFITGETAKVNASLLKYAGAILAIMLLMVLFLLVGILKRWEIFFTFTIASAVPSNLMDLGNLRRNTAVSQAVKKVVYLSRKLKSGACVGPILDVLGSGVDREQKTELLECLRMPLIRIEPEQVAQLSASQLRTLERISIEENNEHVTLAGLLVLGSAGYRLAEWQTVLSWARTPTRHGAAAREYLQAVGGMVR